MSTPQISTHVVISRTYEGIFRIVSVCVFAPLPQQTNYSSTFVENSKLKRLLLKVEKDIGKIQAGKDTRQKATAKAIRAVRVGQQGW